MPPHDPIPWLKMDPAPLFQYAAAVKEKSPLMESLSHSIRHIGFCRGPKVHGSENFVIADRL